MVGLGVPQEQIRRVVINPQTGKPLSVKTLELAFALEIKIGTVQLTALIGSFLIDSVLGRKPRYGVPIKNDQARMTGAIFYLKCRAGWNERDADQRAHGRTADRCKYGNTTRRITGSKRNEMARAGAQATRRQ
jgi:hypothetical protein